MPEEVQVGGRQPSVLSLLDELFVSGSTESASP